MKNFEKSLFDLLANSSGFYIKDYYSNSLKDKKWVAILEKKDFIYAVIVSNGELSDLLYSEAYEYLARNYTKQVSLNIVITVDDNYEEYKYKRYNKLIYSLSEKQVVYSDESCKPLVSIIGYTNKKKKSKKEKFKSSSVTYSLIIINILIFVITSIISKNIYDIDIFTLIRMGAKVNVLINNGQAWRLLTCAFLHGGFMHLAFNMYALKSIGTEVEYAYGKKKYLFIYLFSALGGSLFSYIFNPKAVSVGASGAIFGLFGAMIVFGFKNRHKIGKEYMMSIFKVVVINIIIGVTISNIDNFAHMGGLLFGGALAAIVKNKKIYSE